MTAAATPLFHLLGIYNLPGVRDLVDRAAYLNGIKRRPRNSRLLSQSRIPSSLL